MTAEQAWLYIANRYTNHIPNYGICLEVQLLYQDTEISYSTKDIMEFDLDLLIKRRKRKLLELGYIYPVREFTYTNGIQFSDRFDTLRAKICEKLAKNC